MRLLIYLANASLHHQMLLMLRTFGGQPPAFAT
jgi:hypothetical protein